MRQLQHNITCVEFKDVQQITEMLLRSLYARTSYLPEWLIYKPINRLDYGQI